MKSEQFDHWPAAKLQIFSGYPAFVHVSKLYSFKSEQFNHRPATKLLDVIFLVYAAFVHLSKLYSLRKAPHPSAFKVNNNFKCVGLAVH